MFHSESYLVFSCLLTWKKQRKISTSFRESALIEILKLCLTTLGNNLTYAGTGEQKV